MRKIVIGLLLALITLPCMAYKTEDMYIMRLLEDGKLYFISENIFESNDVTHTLPFDITYFTASDSVSIKMSVYDDVLSIIDSVALLWDDQRVVNTQPISIYKEKEKKRWVHRCDCAFSYQVTKQAITNKTAPSFVIYTSNGAITYTLATKKWEKLVPHLREIFMIIDSSMR